MGRGSAGPARLAPGLRAPVVGTKESAAPHACTPKCDRSVPRDVGEHHFVGVISVLNISLENAERRPPGLSASSAAPLLPNSATAGQFWTPALSSPGGGVRPAAWPVGAGQDLARDLGGALAQFDGERSLAPQHRVSRLVGRVGGHCPGGGYGSVGAAVEFAQQVSRIVLEALGWAQARCTAPVLCESGCAQPQGSNRYQSVILLE